MSREDFELQEVLACLTCECADAGGQKAWADMNGVSPAYVSDVLAKRRMPGDSILKPLGFERITIYRALPTPSPEDRP